MKLVRGTRWNDISSEILDGGLWGLTKFILVFSIEIVGMFLYFEGFSDDAMSVEGRGFHNFDIIKIDAWGFWYYGSA